MIRLASAHAKARLSHKVEETDAAKAVDLMSFALYHETVQDSDDVIHAGSSKDKLRHDDDDEGNSIDGRYVSASSSSDI